MGAAAFDFFFGHWAREQDAQPTQRPHESGPLPAVQLSVVDAALTARLRSGDTGALEAMFHEHAAPLEQYARRLLGTNEAAQDIVQDVFVWLWETRAEFAPRTSVRAYLFGAVRHRTFDAIRRDRVRHRYASRPVMDGEALKNPTPEQVIEHAELHEIVIAALAMLTPRVREVAELRWYGRLSYREIAALLGVSERTVNTQLVAATRNIRARLERYWRER